MSPQNLLKIFPARPVAVRVVGGQVLARLQAHTALGNAVIELARVKASGRLPEGIVQASR